MILPVLEGPNPILRQKSQAVAEVDQELWIFIQNLADTLVKKTDPPGVGISAVQVGRLDRIFFTYLDVHQNPLSKFSEANPELELYINPQITRVSPKKILGGPQHNPFIEGCLSLPYIFGPVLRHAWIEMQYQSVSVSLSYEEARSSIQTKKQRFSDFPARVIQHEMDHLDGILFTDRTIDAGLQVLREYDGDFIALTEKEITW